ncbi:MAG: hypothetical protein RIC53_16540 [Cyclobacteriaceae bacterium]
MSQIKQLLILHQQGKGKKMIARTLGMSKNTVKSYLDIHALTSGGSGIELTSKDLLKLENPELEAKFHAGSPAYKKDDRYEHLISHIEYYLGELKRTGVNKRLSTTPFQ